MPPLSPALNHLATLTRLLDGWVAVNADSLTAATSLTNLILGGAYPAAAARPPGGCRATLLSAVRERDAHRAAVAEAYGAVQASLGAMLRWHGELQDAASSLQGALDGAAARGGAGGGGAPPPALLAAERARDLLADLVADFGAEAALRSVLARSLLPRSCGGAWARLRRAAASQAPPPAAEGGAEGAEDAEDGAAAEGDEECLEGGPGLSRDGESDREALTVALSAWAVPVHATPARVARMLEALHHLAAPR